MNRICIVRRRKKIIQEIEGKADFISDTRTVSTPYPYRRGVALLPGSLRSVDNADDTPGEAARLRLATVRADVGDGRRIRVDVKGNDGTHIILKLNFDRPQTGLLLKSDDVSNMLQVSKSFVAKLVRARAITGHKTGRHRWFALEEIVDYLTRNERVANS